MVIPGRPTCPPAALSIRGTYTCPCRNWRPHCRHCPQCIGKHPPELAADVAKNGILLTGGGSMLRGLAGYIAGELHVDVAIAPDPINCVARGTAASLTLGQYLTAGFRDATPRAWHNRLQSPEGFFRLKRSFCAGCKKYDFLRIPPPAYFSIRQKCAILYSVCQNSQPCMVPGWFCHII